MIKISKMLFILIILTMIMGCGNERSIKVYSEIGLKSIAVYSKITDFCKYYNTQTYITDFICNKSSGYVFNFKINKDKINSEDRINVFKDEGIKIKLADINNVSIYEFNTTDGGFSFNDGTYSPNSYGDLIKLEKGGKYKITIELPDKALKYDIEMYLGLPLSYLF